MDFKEEKCYSQVSICHTFMISNIPTKNECLVPTINSFNKFLKKKQKKTASLLSNQPCRIRDGTPNLKAEDVKAIAHLTEW
jgi:hypothetical protein